MKQAITTIIIFCFAISANAQRSQPINLYQQKKLTDNLQLLFPDLSTPKDEISGLFNVTMPVFALSNKATFNEEIVQGKIYTMKLDNMRILQPEETNAAMPNAVREKTVTVPPLPAKP